MNSAHWEVPPKDLCNRFDPQQFSFKTTEELPQEEEVIGQERAVRAMENKNLRSSSSSVSNVSNESSES